MSDSKQTVTNLNDGVNVPVKKREVNDVSLSPNLAVTVEPSKPKK
jgi:hypothetical protein